MGTGINVNIAQRLVHYTRKVIIGPNGMPYTLRDLVCTAIAAVIDGDKKPGQLQKKVYLEGLAYRMWTADVLELHSEDITALKERVADAFPSNIIVGAAIRALESAGVDLSEGIPDQDPAPGLHAVPDA